MITLSVPDAILLEQSSLPTSFLLTVQLLFPRQADRATFIESGWLHVPSSGAGHSLGSPCTVCQPHRVTEPAARTRQSAIDGTSGGPW